MYEMHVPVLISESFLDMSQTSVSDKKGKSSHVMSPTAHPYCGLRLSLFGVIVPSSLALLFRRID